MWRARGMRLPVQYFFQNHLFDVIHGTDTHFRLEKADYAERPDDFASGVLYMSSLTREVKHSLRWIRRRVGRDFCDFQFFDLGCGKGKPIIVYLQMFGRHARHKAIGVEYYGPLADTAEENLRCCSDISDILGCPARSFVHYWLH